MSCSSALFVSGDIYLIKRPVPGNVGIHVLFNKAVSGDFGFKYDLERPREIWVVTLNKRRRRLSILHIDDWGYEQIIRYLFSNSPFSMFFENDADFVKLTRGQLRRLVIDGSVEGGFNNAFVQAHQKMLNIIDEDEV